MLPSSFTAKLIFVSLIALGDTVKTNRSALYGISFKFSAYNFPPMFATKRTPDGNYTYDGFAFQVSRLISEFFRMNASFVHVDQRKSDLTMALADQLRNKEVDLAAFSFEIRLGSTKFVAVSYPIWMANKALLQRWPEEESRLLAPVRPFTFEVWIGFFASTAGFVTFMCVLALSSKKIKDEGNSAAFSGLRIMLRDTRAEHYYQTTTQIVFGQLEYVVTIITNQGNYIRYSAKQCIRIVISCWLLAMVVMVYAYTGVLTAFLSVPKLKPIVNTFEEVIANRLRVTIETHGLLTDQIMEAKAGAYKIIGDSLRKDPSLFIPLPTQALDNILHHGTVYPAVIEMGSLLITMNTRSSAKCRLTMSLKPLPFYVGYQAGFAVDSPYKETIQEHFLIYMWDTGMFAFWRDKYSPPSRQCRVDNRPETNTKPISLTDLTAPFFILGLGVSMATIAFLLEKIYYFAQWRWGNTKM